MTVTDLLLARAEDDGPGLRSGDLTWTWREHVQECADYAAALRLLRKARRLGAPFHVGILADNIPEFSFLLGGAALAGAVLVGLNPTRRGGALTRDIDRADCQFVLVDGAHAGVMDAAAPTVPVFRLDRPGWQTVLASQRGASLDPAPADDDDLLMLIFTSGTSGDPKAVRCPHRKIAGPGRMLAERFSLTSSDTVYVAMPMFHSNAIMAGWSVGLAAGATIALRHRFSASGFLSDIRRFGATYANYVGTPLSYVLATPAQPDDADNPLRIAYGNEGAAADLTAFATRFNCQVVDGFGSTEGGVSIARTPDTPADALGPLPDGVAILHPEHRTPCPPAEFDTHGALRNGAAAIGELVNTAGVGAFAGYYNDQDAEADRLRDGGYYSGDLAYADTDGYCYFAGRSGDWLRVDGENLGTAPIERALLHHPDIAEVAVYGIPTDHIGDHIVAAVVLTPNTSLTLGALSEFLTAHTDLTPKQHPTHLRVLPSLPRTPTFKVLKRVLASELP